MHPTYDRMIALCSTKEELDATIDYLYSQMSPLLKQGEAVLICFPHANASDFGSIVEQVVLRCSGHPVFWDRDLRWRELLRLSFVSKASTIVAPPLIVLGLTKLSAKEGIPLYFYNAILAGYPCMDWMMDGIEKGLDCRIWGIFGPGASSILSGFSCSGGRGIHIRDDKYGIEIVDRNGNELPDGSYGRIVVYNLTEPETRFQTSSYGRIYPQRCACGNPAPKLTEIDIDEYGHSSTMKLYEDLMYWNSILDCRVSKTECGLDLEVICFPGEKMPKLPSCAKLLVRAWNRDVDIPLSLNADWTKP